MLKVITVPSNSSIYKYTFEIRGKKGLIAGEFVAESFWDADRMLEDIVYSYNCAEWNRDPGMHGANLVHNVKLWAVGNKGITPRVNGKVFCKIDEFDKEYDLYQKIQIENQRRLASYEKMCQVITCIGGVLLMLLVIAIGVFGESIVRHLIP